jgi:hypothetical protein
MQRSGDTRGVDRAMSMPTGFKYVIGAAALFIAGCSAYFSVVGLGLLFIGSATAVMIMAGSLEVGKLVAAAFLYRYWHELSRPIRLYLTVAVAVLIAITSLGNYGYLARAYERTNTNITLLETQIAALEREIADTEQQIDNARRQLGRVTDTGRGDIADLQQRRAHADQSLDQSLAQLQDRRRIAQDRRDRDIAVHTRRLAEQTEVFHQSLAAESAAVAGLHDRLAVLDRAVDAYTQRGGPGFFKADSIKRGHELREKQQPERDAIAAALAGHAARQVQLRADHARQTDLITREINTVRDQFTAELARLDAEELDLRAAQAGAVAQLDQQLAALQTTGHTWLATADTQIETLYQRMRARHEEIRHLREQIAATDIGSYRFVARAFDAEADNVVKWLILALVLVIDPLAVALAVGFNVALLREYRARHAPRLGPPPSGEFAEPALTAPARRNRVAAFGATVALLAVLATGVALAGHWGLINGPRAPVTAHAALVPADSFAVVTVHPAVLQRSAQNRAVADRIAGVAGPVFAESLAELAQGGLDPRAAVYAFAKFPARRAADATDRPVMLCGLVVRVRDAAAAEAALSRLADKINDRLGATPAAAPASALARNRAMIRHGQGRYMDPEGGFFTFGIADRAAMLLLEIEGDPAAPGVEDEIRAALAPSRSPTQPRDSLPAHALRPNGVVAVWLDAARLFAQMPKNPAAQTRYQQLQRHVSFELTLAVQPGAGDQFNVIADYAYQTDRFKTTRQTSAVQLLAELGPADAAGIPGRLLDRCADTLDYDSLIDRLRVTLGGHADGPIQHVLVEKSYGSARWDWKYGPSSWSSPSHFRPSRIVLRDCSVLRATSVSSMRSTKVPPVCRA